MPLAGLTLAGGYLFYEQKIKEQKRYLKANLKKDSRQISKKIDRLLLSLSKEIEQIVTNKVFPEKSLFSAVALKETATDNYEILTPEQPDGSPVEKDLATSKALFQQLTTRLPKKQKSHTVWFQNFSPEEGQAKTEIIALMFNTSLLSSWEGPQKDIAVGFMEYKNFRQILPLLNLNNREAREALLSTSQGWLLFHTNQKSFLEKLPPSSLLGKAIEKSKRQARFVKWEKENQMNLAYILPYKRANLFIAAKTPFKQAPFVLGEWELWWFALCLGALAFILSALILILSPLFSAYTQLKKALLQYGLQGKLPSITSSYNPFLRFYSNIEKAIQNRENSEKPKTPENEKRPTFKGILEEEFHRLKKKYPGLSIQQDIKANVAVWQFAAFMKKILSALLLNALEAMGGSPSQNITVRAWQDESQFIFTIEDEGPGIKEKEIQKAFSLYYSTKSQLGVGLNIVESLVTANNGNIELIPLKEKGIKARVSLPVSCFLKTQNPKSVSFFPKNKSPTGKDKSTVHFFSTENPDKNHSSGSALH